MFESIGKACGGLNRVDHRSLEMSDLRWAGILLRPTSLNSIPCCVKISDGKITYHVVVVVKDDWEEICISTPVLKPKIHRSRRVSSNVLALVAIGRFEKELSTIHGSKQCSKFELLPCLAQVANRANTISTLEVGGFGSGDAGQFLIPTSSMAFDNAAHN